MSKELEGKQYYLDVVDNLKFAEMHFEANEMKKLVEYLFTPPTKEEVCEALSKHLGYEVEAWNEYGEMCFKSVYTSPFQRISKNYETIIWLHGNNVTFREELRLSPHLITLIGRFYEGLESHK